MTEFPFYEKFQEFLARIIKIEETLGVVREKVDKIETKLNGVDLQHMKKRGDNIPILIENVKSINQKIDRIESTIDSHEKKLAAMEGKEKGLISTIVRTFWVIGIIGGLLGIIGFFLTR